MKSRNIVLRTSGRFGALALIVLIEITVCGYAEQKKSFDYGDIHEAYLSLQSITSLPNNAIFLGGSYRTSIGPVHSCILISRDAGKIWSDVPLQFAETTVARFQTYGERMVWALIVNSKEGSEWPEYLAISRDSGMSWKTVSLSFIGPSGPLLSVDDFRFVDASHGILSTRNSLGSGRTYQTSNSGKTWKRVWDTSTNPDFGSFQYPAEPEPLHASLWSGGKSDATGLVRVLLDETQAQNGVIGPYRVQRMIPSTNKPDTASRYRATWEDVAEIPYDYAIQNGSLQPVRQTSRHSGY